MSEVQQIEHYVEAAYRSVDLGPKERRGAGTEMLEQINSLPTDTIYDLEKWVSCASALSFLYRNDRLSVDRSAIEAVLDQSTILWRTKLDDVTPETITSLKNRSDWPSGVHPFERFSEIVERFADLVDTDYEKEKSGNGLGVSSEVLRGALAFQAASRCRYSDLGACLQILSEAIEFYPNQPVFHFVRYRWLEEYLLLKEAGVCPRPLDVKDDEIEEIVEADRLRAKELYPEWNKA